MAVALIACDTGSSGGGSINNGPYATVTFEVYGGTPVSSQRVPIGETATKPPDPKKGYTFVQWHGDNRLIPVSIYDFDTPVTQNITLYAEWGSYDDTVFQLGGPGLAGGQIFYKSSTGFTLLGDNKTCHYLEVALVEYDNLQCTTSSTNAFNNANTVSDMGGGKRNTANIVTAATSSGAYAAASTTCFLYRGGDRNDWFLPSLNELKALYDGKGNITGLNTSTKNYWSSSRSSDSGGAHVYKNFSTGVESYGGNTSYCSVRPIRAF